MRSYVAKAYDELGRLEVMTLADPDGGGGDAAPEVSFTYDALGRTLTETDPLGNVTSYAYADYGHTVTITQPDPDGGGALAAPVTAGWHGFYPCLTRFYEVRLLANSGRTPFDFTGNGNATLPQNGSKSTRHSHATLRQNGQQTRVEPVPPRKKAANRACHPAVTIR